MYNILRTASLELQTIENKDVVKVAGVLNKLKNYLRQLGDKEYASAVEVLRADSWMVQQVSTSLRKKIKELTEAIDDGDIDAYDAILGEVRELTSELAIELKNLNKDVQVNDPRNQANENVTEIPEQQAIPVEDLPLKYNREQWDDPKQRANIFDQAAKLIKMWHPDHDVPIGQNVNRPFNSFKWFDDKEIHINYGGTKNAKERLIDQTARILVSKIALPYEEGRSTFENSEIFDELARRLVNAIRNGTVLHYTPATPSKEPKNKSRTWIKERQIGEMSITVKTADFVLPVYDVTVSMTAGLTDMSVPLNGVNKLVLGYTEYSRASGKGIPLLRREDKKDHELLNLPTPELELPVAPKITPSTDTEVNLQSPPIIPEVSDIKPDVPEPEVPNIEVPVQKKRVRRKKTTALRLELLQGLLKNAGLDLTAVQKLSENFWIRFVEMSKRLGARPEDLAKVINSESGFDPRATNVQDGKVIAKGLNQLTKKTAKALGMSEEEWKSYENVPAEEQLKYVEKFFRSVGNMTGVGNKWESATQLYVANFAPKYVRQASNPNTVLYSKQDNSDAYNKNIGLDRDKKGYITAGDLARSVSTRPLSTFIVQALEKAKMVDASLQNVSMKNKPSNDNNVDGLLTALFALDVGPVEKIVKHALEKKYLPASNVLVTISSLSSPFDVSMKFARSISLLLKEIIDAEVSIHTDGKKIELQCTASGSQYAVASAIKALCDCVAVNLELNTRQFIKYAVIPSTLSKHAKV